MSETTVPNAGEQGGNSTGETPTGGDAFKPITSQDDLNRVIADRISRERAKFADYDDLKAKAARLDEIDEANKSEIQKAQDALTAARAERDQALAQALRSKIQASHGISDADAALFLTGTDEETLTKQAEALAARTSAAGKAPVIPQLGGSTQSPASTADQFAKALESALGG